ncbi:MAG: radical SAM family heme chaperone HemW [Thermoleophilia bacterium]|nr:radical SAM family heme chaperone HemW [Thermoleophilia bacterium]
MSATADVRHLYVHVPFCAHRCGYCDFVTLVGRSAAHGEYVEALLRELELVRPLLAEPLATVFVGGGTPTFTEASALGRLLSALPRAEETTVEANPETVSKDLARALARAGVTRVSLGAQSFQPHLLAVLERRATPEAVRQAFSLLRAASFDNISLDLLYGIPGQSPADLERDLGEALALGPEHVSAYELEAKPGTRFSHAHGAELEGQAEAMEGYFERVVATLVGAGYRWYETANFCRPGRESRHNLGYWLGHDYIGIGLGAVSTVRGRRWRNAPSLSRYTAALRAGGTPPREVEELDAATRARERLMLALRLDRPVALADVREAVDLEGLDRAEALGLAAREEGRLRLTRRGRFLGGAVTAELMA